MRQKRDPNAAARKIFNPTGKTYLYSIPAMYRYSEEYNRKVGHVSTGDKLEDEKLMNEPVHIGGSIEDILKLFVDGVPIKLRYTADFSEIYDLLQEHISNWVEYTTNDPNVKKVPIESLQIMQEFMDTIQSQVKGARASAPVDGTLSKRRTMLFSGMSRTAPAPVAGTVAEVVKPTAPKTNPMIERMNRLLEERNS